MATCFIKRLCFAFSQSQPKLYIFAGQGTQEKGMLDKLLAIPQANKQITHYSNLLSLNFQQLTQSDPNSQLHKTSITQPLLVLSQVLHYKYLQKTSELQSQDFMIGHSIGEYSALCIAGSLDLEKCLKLVRKRGLLMEEFGGQASGMIIVRYADQRKEEVMRIIKETEVQIACYNTPNNINVAGPLQNLQQTVSRLKTSKITCLPLPVSSAFHCSILAPMVTPYTQYINTLQFRKPQAQIIRNLDARVYEGDEDIKEGLIKHLTNPVCFWQAVEKVGVDVGYVEIGHGRAVGKWVDETRKKIKGK